MFPSGHCVEYDSSCIFLRDKIINCEDKINGIFNLLKLDNHIKSVFQFKNPFNNNCFEIPIKNHNYESLAIHNYSIINNIQNNIFSNNLNENILDIKNSPSNFQFLIIDDDKYISNSIKILVKRIFKEVNCLIDVIIGSDGFHIIQKVIEDQRNGNKIKCIITDENMEYLNGSEAIKIIRSLEKSNKIKNVKIITATSQDDIQFVNKMKDLGADIVMSKPLSKSTLMKALQDLKIINSLN